MKTRAAIFPVSSETLPLAKYIEEYCDNYHLTTLLTLPGFSLSGKDIGYADNRNNTGHIVSEEINKTSTLWDILLVLDHSDRFGADVVYKSIIEVIHNTIALKKTIICSAILKSEDLRDICESARISNCEFIYLPSTERMANPPGKGRLYYPFAPVIFIGGLIKEANTLEVFLSICGKLKQRGLRVISISANMNCAQVNMVTFSGVLNTKLYTDKERVYALNDTIKTIEEEEHPDVILFHLSEAMLEYNEILPNGFGLTPFLISKAITPDIFICCIPCEFAHNGFINSISQGFANKLGYPINYVHISNAIVDGIELVSDEETTVVYTSQYDVNNRVELLRSESMLSVFNLLEEKYQNQLVSNIAEQLKDDQHIKYII